MSFLDIETSVEDAQPIELFLFENLEEQFAYTSAQETITYIGRDYVPVAMKRSAPTIESQQTQRRLVVDMPINDDFAQRYVATVPASPDQLTVYVFHSTDGGTPEVVVYFSGEVSNVAFTGNTAKVNVLANGRVIQNAIPQQTCRSLCNHVLYDDRCQVVSVTYKIATTVTAISANGLSITVDGGSNVVPATSLQLSAQLTADSTFFNGGYLSRGNIENRMVLESTDNGSNSATFGILLPFQTISIGSALDLYAGCDHSLSVCKTKFSNNTRHGGFPFIPLKNPFQVKVTGGS